MTYFIYVNATHQVPEHAWDHVEVKVHTNGNQVNFTAPRFGCSRNYADVETGIREWCSEHGVTYTNHTGAVRLIPADHTKPMQIMGYAEPTLEEMKKTVGGWIEYVDLSFYDENTGALIGRHNSFILNEEGKLFGLPVNVRATQIFRDRYPNVQDVIVGDVIFFNGVEPDRG